ncbi:MAG: PKD domain-containing protein [Flavobacteriales bacterium]|nr:PKD domain-containing protein [Flavobacteriales bacterium]
MRTFLSNILFSCGLGLLSFGAQAQCPQLYDHLGTPVNAPQWYSCSGSSYTLLVASPQTIGAFTIDWGDGSPVHNGVFLSPPLSVSHVYTAAVATYTVTFTEIATGCVVTGTLTMEQSTSASIQIPIGGLTQICAPQAVEFINSSTNTSPNTVFIWDFGDASPPLVFDHTNLGQTISHTYLPGTVGCETTVSLSAENTCNTLQGGPSIATFNPIRIWDLDTAQITPSATLLCYPDTVVTFLNTTLRNCLQQGNIYQRFEYWNFGDYWGTGQDSIIDWTPWPPTFPRTIAYPGIGTYTAMLLDSNYCGIDTAYVTITIVPPPAVTLTATPNPVCAGGTIVFQQTTTGGANFFEWDFGQGAGWQTTGPGNQSRVYNTPGTYTIRYRASIAGATPGCVSMATVTITVLPSPVAQFTVSPVAACNSLTAAFTNTSTGATGWNWQFGDGQSSTAEHPAPHLYASPGLYTITLTVSTAQGCTASAQQQVQVFAPPTVQIIASSLCFGELSMFTPQVIGSPGDPVTQYQWDFGDGQQSTQQSPLHSYGAPGPYTVTLTVTTTHCQSTTVQPVFVHPKPDASFTAAPDTGCTPVPVAFTNTSTGASTWFWNFGDGNTSAAFAPSHTYINAGGVAVDHAVMLIATSAFGCRDTAFSNVHVTPGVVAAFAHNGVPACAPLNVAFTNQSMGAFSYAWDFGDGATSTAADPDHQYINNTLLLQTFTVKLVAYSQGGCVDSTEQQITVYPLPSFTFSGSPSSGCAPHLATMPNVVGAVVLNWDFGDGTTGTGPMPAHVYGNGTPSDVTYPVTLIALNAFGCADTIATQVTVFPDPVAQFSPSVLQGCQPLAVTFNDQSLGAQTLYWDFGDGTTTMGIPGVVIHSYNHGSSAPVDFTVTQVAESANGCRDTTTRVIQVFPAVAPQFNVPPEGCSPVTVNLQDLGTGATIWQWDFGDGTVAAGQTVSHTYVNNGTAPVTYTITLTSTSAYGCSAIAQQSIVVHPVPNAAFTASPLVQMWPDATVSVVNLTGPGPWTHSWFFGDGATSPLASPGTHTYGTWGVYTIQLIVNGGPCSGMAQQVVEIIPPLPTASFIGSGEGCVPLTVSFTNTSLLGLTYQWNFGDGGTSSAEHPTYTFNTPGTYTVSLMAFGVGGGVNVAVHVDSIVVHPRATAYFLVQPNEVVAPNDPVFTYNLSNNATSYWWDFGDGATYTSFDPVHYYQAAGTFDITLVANNQWNCPDTMVLPAAVTSILGGNIHFPNAFTPGNGGAGDGVYDPQSVTNTIFFPLHEGVVEYHLQIFNRWGELVFESTDVRRGWDGYYRGRPAKQDVYAWKAFARFIDGKERILKGDVTLLR